MKKRIFLLLVIAAVLFCSVPLGAVAADQTTIENSSVEDDLKSEYGDLSAVFPKKASDTKIYLVSFMEYGYTAWSGIKSDDYGLYLYIYNPSGKSVLSDTNKVQFATRWQYDGEGSWVGVSYTHPLPLPQKRNT